MKIKAWHLEALGYLVITSFLLTAIAFTINEMEKQDQRIMEMIIQKASSK